MLTSLASAITDLSRGFMPGSPPPFLAATVNSLMIRVKILPRLASAAPFLCLMVCHLEWPDIATSLLGTRLADSGLYNDGLVHRSSQSEGGNDRERRERSGTGKHGGPWGN